MRISKVVPLPVTVATAREPMSLCLLRIETDDGHVGYGEACDSYGSTYAGLVGEVVREAYGPMLLGAELHAVEPLVERLRDSTRRRLGDAGLAVQALSAVEIALWDLLGRSAGSSVSALLGRVRERIPVYASWTFLEEGTAGWHHENLLPWLDRGIRRVKVRIGPDWRSDLATLRELCALLPEVELMVDGSETFTVPTALRIAAVLADLDVVWFEEPVPVGSRAALREVAARSPVALAYGEHLYSLSEAQDGLARREFSVLQPDPAVMGGIGVARRVAQLGAYHGVRVVPHICAGPVALAAGLHLAASVSAVQLVEYPVHLVPVWEQLGLDLPVGLDAITGGTVEVPSGPGLGVRVNESTVAEHPYQAPGRRVAGTLTGLPDRFVGRV